MCSWLFSHAYTQNQNKLCFLTHSKSMIDDWLHIKVSYPCSNFTYAEKHGFLFISLFLSPFYFMYPRMDCFIYIFLGGEGDGVEEMWVIRYLLFLFFVLWLYACEGCIILVRYTTGSNYVAFFRQLNSMS